MKKETKNKTKLSEKEIRRNIHKVVLEILDWGKSFAVSFSIFIIIFTLFLINAKVPSSSMENTLTVNTRLIANRLAYSFGNEVEYEDIIIFPAPDEEEKLYVKRVVGLEGDTIQIIDGKTYRNGNLVYEPYVNVQTGNYGPYVVPKGTVFVMGDNRNNSWDARFWEDKYVKIEDIKGKALFTYWPLNELKIL